VNPFVNRDHKVAIKQPQGFNKEIVVQIIRFRKWERFSISIKNDILPCYALYKMRLVPSYLKKFACTMKKWDLKIDGFLFYD